MGRIKIYKEYRYKGVGRTKLRRRIDPKLNGSQKYSS